MSYQGFGYGGMGYGGYYPVDPWKDYHYHGRFRDYHRKYTYSDRYYHQSYSTPKSICPPEITPMPITYPKTQEKYIQGTEVKQTPSCTYSPTDKNKWQVTQVQSSRQKDSTLDLKQLGIKFGLSDLRGRINTKCHPGPLFDFYRRPIFIFVMPPCGPHEPPPPPPLEISGVDLCIEDNSVSHHTDKYEMVEEGYTDDLTKLRCSAQLVIRRGQEFKVKLTVNRQYTKCDHISVISMYGKFPHLGKGTYNEMITGVESDSGWSIRVVSTHHKQVELEIMAPANCPVGEWKLLFNTVSIDADGTVSNIMKESITEKGYILFNAWCKDDTVYMDNEEWRQEYVLNDSGKLYVGNHRQIFGRPWNFGQFESCVLQAALFLLNDKTCMKPTAKGNPIMVSRKLSALVNANDEGGVLAGNWHGPFCDGIRPRTWTGSVAILQMYMESGGRKPVKYGQCWVFAGVLTTVCRALGIPTRPVSNFNSAHDTDGNLTIDVYRDCHLQPIEELNQDSVWNFHVWNECWMSRPDLKCGYDGWQVVDSTPQERSDGVFCAGPAPVAAVKNGDVGISYDTPFVFAEVNADKVYWIKWKNRKYIRKVLRDYVGKKISTKAVGSCKDFTPAWWNPDRVDITDEYKYPEHTLRERLTVWKAMLAVRCPADSDYDKPEDVKFTVTDIEEVFFGQSFNVVAEVRNQSSHERTVKMTMILSSAYYTGMTRTHLKTEEFFTKLCPHSKETFMMRVNCCDYERDMACGNGYDMKIDHRATVEETDQIFIFHDDFRLRTLLPEIIIIKKRVRIRETFTVKAVIKNPLGNSLKSCAFHFEAAGHLKPTILSQKSDRYGPPKLEVRAGGTIEAECEITAKRHGECVVIVSFECEQMVDIQGQCTVLVDRF